MKVITCPMWTESPGIKGCSPFLSLEVSSWSSETLMMHLGQKKKPVAGSAMLKMSNTMKLWHVTEFLYSKLVLSGSSN